MLRLRAARFALVVGLGVASATSPHELVSLAAEPVPAVGTALPKSAPFPLRAVEDVPDELRKSWKLHDFHQRLVLADGLPILGSKRVAPRALQEAAYLIDRLLAGRDDLRQAIVAAKIRVVVMAPDEFTLDVPEHSDLRPAEYWNRRARGLGATRQRPAVSCGSENLLELPGDPYRGENILIHEFAHVIHEIGLRSVDATFQERLEGIRTRALAAGLWKDTYAATNPAEYWAEGVQSWFDCNAAKGGVHNGVRDREALRRYDPELAKLLTEVFGDPAWRYDLPSTRKGPHAVSAAEREALPRFAWPEKPAAADAPAKDGPAGKAEKPAS